MDGTEDMAGSRWTSGRESHELGGKPGVSGCFAGGNDDGDVEHSEWGLGK